MSFENYFTNNELNQLLGRCVSKNLSKRDLSI